MNEGGKGKAEMDAREILKGDGQDLVSAWRWERGQRGESELVESLNLGDWENGHPKQKGNPGGKAGLGEDNSFLCLWNLR